MFNGGGMLLLLAFVQAVNMFSLLEAGEDLKLTVGRQANGV